MTAVVAAVLIGLLTDMAVALEEPAYTVIENRGDYEIRHYEPYIVAEFEFAAASERSAGGNAFRVLAAYIFGDNSERKKMAMTAPVETSLALPSTADTARVVEGNRYVYSFVMERRYTQETLPEPLDPRIHIRERPARYVAALRYSGSGGESRYRRHRNKLALLLRADRLSTASGYSFARYDSPWTPPGQRRNEVLVDIDWREQRASTSR